VIGTKLVEEAVTAYVAIEETDYALGISGAWGTGKSHFWTHDLTSLLDAAGIPSIHISLYGVESANDIDNAIYTALSNVGGDDGDVLTGLIQANANALNLGGVGLVVQFGLNKWKEKKIKESTNILLCFDDLERANNLGCCLAYLNRLCEQNNTKVIVISNADAIDWKPNEHQNFLKTIRFNYEFKNTPEKTLKIGLKSAAFSSAEVQKYTAELFADHQSTITSVLDDASCSNIRTITKSITYFDRICSANFAEFSLAPDEAASYFISLLSTLILIDHIQLTDRDKSRLLDPSVTSHIDFEDAFGRIADDEPKKEKDEIAEGLLTHAIYMEKSQLRFGIVSIVTNGFYIQEDFQDAFTNWRPATPLELYLNTLNYWSMTDEEAKKTYEDAYELVMEHKVNDPNLLAKFVARTTLDIKRGLLDEDVELLISSIIGVINELYDSQRMAEVRTDFYHIGEEGRYCRDILEKIGQLNDTYLTGQKRIHLPTGFWKQLGDCTDADELHELFYKYDKLPIFASWSTEKEVLDALDGFNNATLLALVRSLGSRVTEPECKSALEREEEKSKLLGLVIKDKYKTLFGVRASHFKQLYRLLIYQTHEYEEPEEENDKAQEPI